MLVTTNRIDNSPVLNQDFTIRESFGINQIKPLVDGFYETCPNLLDDSKSLLTDYYNLTIPGTFLNKKRTFSSELQWIQKAKYR